MPLFLKIFTPFLVLLLIHFFYLNGKKLINNQYLYRLEKVSFLGVEKSDPYEIINILGLEKGANLLFLDTEELTKKIKTIPRYKQVRVLLQYPDTIILELDEKKPYFVISFDNQFYTVDVNGEMTERNEEIKNFDLFFIQANDFENIRQIIQHDKFKKFIRFYQMLPEKEKDIFKIFSSLSMSYLEKDWVLYGNRKGFTFNLGKVLTFEKLRKARYAYIYGNQKNILSGDIFITDDLVYYSFK